MLISISIASTRPTEHTEDVDKAKDKALAYIKEIMIRIHTIKDIYIEENTREAKEIKNSDKRNTMSVTNKAAG
jgi:hypothetical protein